MSDERTRASRGEMAFDAAIDSETREVIRAMWRTRLAGFAEIDLTSYMRHNTSQTRYKIGRWRLGGDWFRRLSWLLFVARRVMRVVGVTVSAEIYDAVVVPRGREFATQGELCVRVCGRVLRRKAIDMTAVSDGDNGWRWGNVVATRPARMGAASQRL